MTIYLADSSLLIALTVKTHVHHDVARGWFEREEPDVATCPITEGALVRLMIREGNRVQDTIRVLDNFRANPWHRFWPDDIGYDAAMLDGVLGHRQITDSYLVALAAHHGGVLATLDRGLAALHPEVTLIDT